MTKTLTVAMVALLAGSAGTFGYMHYQENKQNAELAARVLSMEQEAVTLKDNLLGYTKYVDYLSITKMALTERMKFLAAKVDREHVQVQHLQKSILTLKMDATVMVTYTVEYSVGYDLQPTNFSVAAEHGGIVIRLKKPELVASPAVKIVSSQVLGTGLGIDEKGALIELQQQLPEIALAKGKDIPNDEAVIALCEKKLGEFLQDFLAKQPNVKIVPTIKFVYV